MWVIQEGKFAYTVLPEYTRNAYFCQETLKTDWVKYNAVNEGKKDLPATADALRLWIDHGRDVKDGTYGYVVYAGEGLPSEDLPFEVLRNDTSIQAKEITVSYNGHEISVPMPQGALCGKAVSATRSITCRNTAPCLTTGSRTGRRFSTLSMPLSAARAGHWEAHTVLSPYRRRMQ